MSAFRETLKAAREKLNRGAFREAFTLIVDEPVNRPDDLFAKIGILADAGVALRDESALQYGLYLLERHAEEILAVPNYAPFHWFNLANLRVDLVALREVTGAGRAWFLRKETAPARTAYRRAAEAASEDDLLQARILTAHGRFLVGLGRDWEAFSLFHEATKKDADDVEALWGRTECLAALAGTVPSMEADLLREARDDLLAVENAEEGPGYDESSRILSAEIEDRLGPDEAGAEATYPKNTVVTRTDQEHHRIMFALEGRLFLSPCSYCRRCDRAVGDMGTLGPVHAVVGEGPPGRFRRMAAIYGRLVERYRALRRFVADHDRGAKWEEEPSSHPALRDWKPASPATVAAMTALAGAGTLLEGMASYLSVYLGRDPQGPVSLESVLGAAEFPREEVAGRRNPGLHAFWDLWHDGKDGLIPGAALPGLLASGLALPEVENLLGDPERFTAEAVGALGWLSSLLGYLVRLTDREARGETGDPPAWPLQPFIYPRNGGSP